MALDATAGRKQVTVSDPDPGGDAAAPRQYSSAASPLRSSTSSSPMRQGRDGEALPARRVLSIATVATVHEFDSGTSRLRPSADEYSSSWGERVNEQPSTSAPSSSPQHLRGKGASNLGGGGAAASRSSPQGRKGPSNREHLGGGGGGGDCIRRPQR